MAAQQGMRGTTRVSRGCDPDVRTIGFVSVLTSTPRLDGPVGRSAEFQAERVGDVHYRSGCAAVLNVCMDAHKAVDRACDDSLVLMGAPKSFDEFFLDESERLLRVLCFVTGSRALAEDIAQDAFTKVFERWESVGTLEDPAGYLHRTAMNMFRNEFRRAKRSLKRAAFARSESDDVFAAVEDRDALSHALSQLTDRQRRRSC